MKLRLLAPAAVLALAGLAVAGDAPTYELLRSDRWQVGDVRTATSKVTETNHVTKSLSDGTVVQELSVDQTTTARLVEKVLAVDDKGHATKVRVHVAEWSQRQGEDEDVSIQGALLEVTGVGLSRTWTLVSEDVTPSDGAKSWLAHNWQEDEDMLSAALLPKKPVAVGGTWPVDIAGLMASGLSAQLTADVSKSSGTGKLESVEGDIATTSTTLQLAVTQVPGLPLTKGSTKLEIGGKTKIKTRLGEGSSSSKVAFEGETSVDMEGQTITIRLEVSKTAEATTKLGGEVPEPGAK